MTSKKEIKSYCNNCGAKAASIAAQNYDKDDIMTSTQDLLTDILHLCAMRKWDFHTLLDDARMHCTAEITGGQHG